MLLVRFPWIDYRSDELAHLDTYNALLNSKEAALDDGGSFVLPVMSFNVRLDGLEKNPNNHFTKRVDRLKAVIERWKPSIAGLQEPYGEQMAHIMRYMPSNYRVIGTHASLQEDSDTSKPNSIPMKRTPDDFQTAILYDVEKLKLLEHDYLWLSTTPRVPYSKNWDSQGVRTLNIARFEIRGKDQELIAFNSHLDVRSEEARREQAKIVAKTIREWREKYPNALVTLTADFNSAPGQTTHRILTSEDALVDSWDRCTNIAADGTCVTNNVASTFHGWIGSWTNTYLARFLSYVAFTVHAMGMNFPNHPPTTFSDLTSILFDKARYTFHYSVAESLPQFPPTRFHVDWVLFGNSENAWIEPKMVIVADVKDVDFSSDHFPVVAALSINKKRQEKSHK